MQTPAGFEILDGLVHPTNWWEAIFNLSFLLRYLHVVVDDRLDARGSARIRPTGTVLLPR